MHSHMWKTAPEKSQGFCGRALRPKNWLTGWWINMSH